MNDSMEFFKAAIETPLGVVHLVGFKMRESEISHREVIFKILSDAAGETVSAEDLHESRENTRPEFPALDFDVNWTHSGGYCVVAYGERGSKGINVGVDLERYSARHLRLADRFYSGDEATYLHGLPLNENATDMQMQEFYRLWCRKEALYKCVGGSFFEGAIGRSVLESPVIAGAENAPREVYFVDLDGKKAAGFPAALCIAVSKR